MVTTSISTDTTVNQVSSNSLRSTIRQGRQDFDQLFQSIQAGNLTAAQQAYADIQSLRSNSASSADSSATTAADSVSASSATGGISADWTALGQALQSGSTDSTQTAFAKLQQDALTLAETKLQQEAANAQSVYALMQGTQTPSNTTSTPQTAAVTGISASSNVQDDLANLSQALQGGDSSSAQQLLAKLEQDLMASGQAQGQGHHHHHHPSSGFETSQSGATAYDSIGGTMTAVSGSTSSVSATASV